MLEHRKIKFGIFDYCTKVKFGMNILRYKILIFQQILNEVIELHNYLSKCVW